MTLPASTDANSLQQVRFSRSTGFSLLITGAYLAVAIPLLIHHSLWRDEAHAYVFVRDTPLREMLASLRYFGHPPLWYLLLYLLKFIYAGPEAMQWLHILLAATTVFLVAHYSPFPPLARLLFAFGYYTLFEYGFISRNYQLVFLAAVLFCIVRTRNPRGYISQGIAIALLCMSHVLGIIIAAGLGVMLVYEAVATASEREYVKQRSGRFAAGLAIAAGFAAISVATIMPPRDLGFAPDWHTQLNFPQFAQTVRALADAYLPLPPWQEHFWNQSLLQPWAQDVAGALLLLALLAAVWRHRGVFLFLLISSVGILAFFYTRYFGFWRHHGMLFVAATAALWLAWKPPREPSHGKPTWDQRTLRAVLFTMLAIHTYAAVVAVYFCSHYPFNKSKEAAAFLNAAVPPDETVIVRNDITVQSLAAYAPGRQFFLPRGSRWGTYTHWRNDFSKHDAATWANLFAAKEGRPVILVLDQPEEILGPRTAFLAGFGGGIVDDEWFYFYRVEPPAPATTR
ncbi:MAG: hypothetical protein ACTHN5_04565 [Phycisphaerae bacterium]